MIVLNHAWLELSAIWEADRGKFIFRCCCRFKWNKTYLTPWPKRITHRAFVYGALFMLPVYLEKVRIKGKISLQKSHIQAEKHEGRNCRGSWYWCILITDCLGVLQFLLSRAVVRGGTLIQRVYTDPQFRVIGEGGRESSSWADLKTSETDVFLQCFFMSCLDKCNAWFKV